MPSSTNSKSKSKSKSKPPPLRIFVKCSWSGARLAVPSASHNITITQLISTLTTANQIPPLFLNRPLSSWNDPPHQPSLVYIHTTVWKRDWDITTIGDMLGKDQHAGGNVLLTLNLPAENNAANNNIAATQAAVAVDESPAPEPMDVDVDVEEEDMKISATRPTSSTSTVNILETVLSKNFDADSKQCLLTCLKIMDNILMQPTNIKMRTLKLSNGVIQRKIVSKNGGLDLLFHIGFGYEHEKGGSISGFDFDNSKNLNVNAAAANTGLDSTSDGIVILRPKPNNEHLDHILQVRKDIVQALIKELNMDPRTDKIPTLPESVANLSINRGTGAGTKKPASAATATAVKFDPFKSHAFNTQAAAAGAPNPNAVIPDGNTGAGSSTTERKLQMLQEKQKKLEANLQPQTMTLSDRSIVAFRPGQVGPIVSLDTHGSASGDAERGDGSLVAAQVRRKMEERKKREEGGFTTKAMRDLEKMKKQKVYSHAQLRIFFPDGTRIEAKFLPNETIATVKLVVASTFHLSSDSNALTSSFDLYISPPRRILDERKTLKDEGLVPAAKIHVSWKAGSKGGLPSQSPIQPCYFQPMSGSTGVTGSATISSFPESVSLEGNTKSSSTNASSSKGDGTSTETDKATREEELMQRMLGKRKGLGLGLGKKNLKNQSSSSSSKSSGTSAGKPKWFKK